MGPQVDSVIPDPDVPAEADIVIIGGGIIGTSAALHLARKGLRVVLCEKGHIAGEQSSRNWGWVRKARRDPREIPLIVESLRQWERMNETVGDETGFRTTGTAFAAESEADVARYETWLEHARPHQIDARMISGSELERHVPGASKRWKTALYCASDGRAEPQKAAPAIARAAQRAGAVILTDCAVRGLDRAGGRVAAVVTERGRIRTAAAVLAGGAWSRRFLRDLDVTLPQLKVRASVMRTAPLEGGPDAAFWFEGAAYRKRLDGGYTIANGYVNVVPIVPDSFRFMRQFWPAFVSEKKALKLRLDGRFGQEMAEAASVPLDRESPYERTRVLDPPLRAHPAQGRPAEPARPPVGLRLPHPLPLRDPGLRGGRAPARPRGRPAPEGLHPGRHRPAARHVRIRMARFSAFDDSLWSATAAPPPRTQALEGRVRADVCIVGAGYTGLTTALELARKGVDVIVLEAQQAGFGGSGRNAGHCTPTFTHHSLPALRGMLGQPWAERLIARQTGANARVSDMIQRYQIQCEWQQNGYVQAAPRPSAIAALERKARDYNAVGAKTRFVGREEVEAITGSPRFFGGWFHTEGGHVNPLGYARGLARAAIQEGAALHTGSKAIGVTPEAGRWSVETDRGAVLAEKVIFTTGAYTVGGWPKLDQSFKIMRVFVAATQPLSAEDRRSVLPQNTTVHDGRGDFYVYKYDAEGRIVASMFPMGRRGRDMDYTRRVMSDRLRWLHPQIQGEIRWEYFWFGELDMQRRTIPRLYGLAPGVVALTGLSGRGVPTGSMLGGILSEWALDVPEKDLFLRVEPLHKAPLSMKYGPRLMLRYYRATDWLRSKMDGAPLPPHA